MIQANGLFIVLCLDPIGSWQDCRTVRARAGGEKQPMPRPLKATFLFDPLCGWCYGAAPMIAALRASPGAVVDLLPAGLFVGDGAVTMSESFLDYVRDADRRVAQVSGQPFSDAYRVDSAAATLALSAVHLEDPAREFEALRALQRLRWEGGRDNSDAGVVAGALEDAGFGAAAARLQAPDAALLSTNSQRIEAGRDLMRRFSIRGVPALLAGQGAAFGPVPSSVLFGSMDDLLAAMGAS
ncbi:MAG: hypothetical protein B7Y84_15930 [Azorhizobium sp. 32-67-21]|nr:MAG: hypothetical protein B7Y84_15930 [Azorhizobium sp. 32-67-21]